MKGLMDGYVERIKEQMEKQPNMILNKEEKWIILEDSLNNIEKFSNLMMEYDISLEDWKIYMHDEDTYFKISEGMQLRYELEQERERQRELENPTVDLDINNKDELIDYMVQELYSLEDALNYEYSTDMELDEVRLNAKHAKLLELVKKYL